MKCTLEAIFALAFKTMFPKIDTRAVVTRFRRAMVNDKGTIGIPVAIATFALVTSDAVDAHFPIRADHVDAVVHVDIADLPFEAAGALADEFPS